MKYYDCKISFQSHCDEEDLKNNDEYIYNFIRNNFWNVYDVKFTYKENNKQTTKDIKNETVNKKAEKNIR
jgi:hypothetical protein